MWPKNSRGTASQVQEGICLLINFVLEIFCKFISIPSPFGNPTRRTPTNHNSRVLIQIIPVYYNSGVLSNISSPTISILKYVSFLHNDIDKTYESLTDRHKAKLMLLERYFNMRIIKQIIMTSTLNSNKRAKTYLDNTTLVCNIYTVYLSYK